MKKSNRVTLKSLPGKVAVITGGNRGIGREVTKMLLNCDMTVILGCKREEKHVFLEEVSTTIPQPKKVIVLDLDVSSLRSVKEFASEIKSKFTEINFLINNAGISCSSLPFSEEGHEIVFATNYLGHFYLTHLLLPLLQKAADGGFRSRIINMSSSAHSVGHINFEDIGRRNIYVQPEVYAQSKLALTLFSNYLCTIMRETCAQVDVHAVDPGLVNTEIYRGTIADYFYVSLFGKIFFKTPREGATVVVFTCLEEELEAKSGQIILNCKARQQLGEALNPVLQEKLFLLSKNLTNISDYGVEQ